MEFYQLWKNDSTNSKYIETFINKDELTINPLIDGNPVLLEEIIKLLLSINIEEFISNITKPNENIDPSMIVQFSNIENAIHNLPVLLNSVDNFMDFNSIGKELIGAVSDGARKKYGENHSKLAKECNFVYFSKKGGLTLVGLTSLGKMVTYLDIEMIYLLVKRLLIRNEFIQNLIYYGKNGRIKYENAAKCLAQSTLIRRKSNNKTILSLILTNTKYEYILDNIIW